MWYTDVEREIAMTRGLAFVGVLTAATTFGVAQAYQPFKVKVEYREAYRSTCAIVASNSTDFNDGGGTGVLLRSGYILTAKHILDRNSDGVISLEERDVNIKFFYPQDRTYKARTVLAGSGHHSHVFGLDYAILRILKVRRKSLVDVISSAKYADVAVGEDIYTIGRVSGDSPPSISRGHTAPPVSVLYDRAIMPVFFGNSGGGVFLKSSGELMGIVSRLKLRGIRGPGGAPIYLQVPHMAEYLPITVIREDLKRRGKLYLLERHIF